jgi:hypothetical protein
MSLLSSVQESQPGNPYYANEGGGGEAGSFTSLAVSGQSSLTTLTVSGQSSITGTSFITGGIITSLGLVYSQRQTLSATSTSNVYFSGIEVRNGTYACTVRGADNLSLYSAMASLWGNTTTGAGQQVALIANSSNVQADPSSALTFNPTNIGSGVYGWRPNFQSSVVNSGSNFTCTLSPNFGA